mmetsp:Transcript_19896/g.30110  ORF Transcript_19896/g.30110 Transcript_19896/m.30110 type:complete len:93 (-) Transcript_19896:173-451(-)
MISLQDTGALSLPGSTVVMVPVAASSTTLRTMLLFLDLPLSSFIKFLRGCKSTAAVEGIWSRDISNMMADEAANDHNNDDENLIGIFQWRLE